MRTFKLLSLKPLVVLKKCICLQFLLTFFYHQFKKFVRISSCSHFNYEVILEITKWNSNGTYSKKFCSENSANPHMYAENDLFNYENNKLKITYP